MAVGAISPIHGRLQFMDFLHGFMDGSAVIVIPNPQPIGENIRAIVKPFQLWVYRPIYK